MKKHKRMINNNTLVKAIKNTFKHRNTKYDINDIQETVDIISESEILKNVFDRYKEKMEYTKNIKYGDTVKSINDIVKILKRTNVTN